MRLKGQRKALLPAILLAVATLGLSACGSGGSTTTVQRPPLTRDTAAHLAKLSDRVATYLDDGQTCDAAQAADDLSAAIQDAHLRGALRSSVDEAATRLVDEVNCPPPPPPAPAPEKKPKHEDHGKGGDHQGDAKKPPGHGGLAPPGHAKLKGEVG